jgi:hypothetical protein
MDNYHLLIQKLDEFIRKYYKNQLIKGAIYAATFSLIFFLVIAVWEYFSYSTTTARSIMFYGFILINLGILTKFIIIPLVHLFKMGDIISHEQASIIIGKHFSNVQDKLLNTLQLRKQAGENGTHSELISASINQKINELKPVPFSSAINLGENKKYLKYLAVPVIVFLVIFFSAPSVITESTARLVNHNTDYAKPAPFIFTIINNDLQTVQMEDYSLQVKVTGSELPDNVYIDYGGNQFKLDKENRLQFNYLFRNVQNNIKFRLFGAGHYSQEFVLEAVPNPMILNFALELNYPSYLNKPDEKLQNYGDLVVPQGTQVTWSFNTRNTDKLTMSFADTTIALNSSNGRFKYDKRFMKNDGYSVHTENKFIRGKDSVYYAVTVIPDAHPRIDFEQQADSFSTKRYFFRGEISDDYGFSRLTFNYGSAGKEGPGKMSAINIPINRNSNREQFFYMWDMNQTEINPGEEIEYFFEVWDNDGVNGAKSARSMSMYFKAPTSDELADKEKQKNEEIKSGMKETMKQAQQMQKDIDDINKRMLEKKELNWEDRKKIEDLLKSQRQLDSKLNHIKNQNERKNAEQQEYKKLSEEILEKQKQLEEMLEKLMTDELRKLMDELEKLLQEMDKQKMQEMMEQMKMSNKDLLKELDRSLEIFKQFEFEQKLQETIDKLEELAKKQEDLSEKSLEKNADNEQLKEEQQKLNEEFEKLSEEMKDLEKKNEELQFPNDFDNPEEDQKDIKEDMEQSEQQLDEKKNKKASQSQKSASDKMKKMAQKMQEQQAQSDMDQMGEDMESLRALLENLIKLSFDQEDLMDKFRSINITDPQYVVHSQQQRKLKDDARMIEDSLFALSKRVPEIESFVNKEINAINNNMDVSIKNLQDRQTAEARSRQQFAMTSVNNLALMLSEVLDQMQQSMAEQMSGNQQCQKPGGKPSKGAGKLKSLQQQLNQRIKDLKDGMQGGKMGKGQMSEELARLAAEQEALRNELQKLNQELNKDGKGSLGNLEDVMKKMEETETDLVNRRITQETLKRQEDILTRLLESERAERERDEEERREATEGKNIINRNPTAFEEYKRLKMKETELLRTVPPSLNPFYKQKVADYFQNINN